MHIHRNFEHEGQILNKFKKFLSISHYICAWFYVIWNHEMVPDRTILHIVEKKIQAGGADPDPLPFKIMACTLLSLSYAPDVNFEPPTPFSSDQKNLTLSLNFVG